MRSDLLMSIEEQEEPQIIHEHGDPSDYCMACDHYHEPSEGCAMCDDLGRDYIIVGHDPGTYEPTAQENAEQYSRQWLGLKPPPVSDTRPQDGA